MDEWMMIWWGPLLLGVFSWVGGREGEVVKMRWEMYEVELVVGGQDLAIFQLSLLKNGMFLSYYSMTVKRHHDP